MHSNTVRPSASVKFCSSPEEGLLVLTSTKMPLSYCLQSSKKGAMPSVPRYPLTVRKSHAPRATFSPSNSVVPRYAAE